MSRLSEYNQSINRWTSTTRSKQKLFILRETSRYSGRGQNVKATTKKYAGEASKISWDFPYYMVFVHKGAGRGYGGAKSGLFTRANGSKGVTNASSMGKMSTGKRRAVPWFNPIVEQRFPELANLVADYHGDKVLLQMSKILIR